ncbi:MAG: hypothetical protein U5N53_27515 [Mycobacterium sp.]|nr:hypothetical protein [Mycobacterium sp.]
MSFPTFARQVDIPARNGTFDVERAVATAIDFCTAHDVARHTRYSVVPRLDQALRIAALTGPDRRWRRMARWSGNNEIEGLPETVHLTDERDILYNRFVAALPEADWLPPNTVTSVSRWARFSPAMREAQTWGLGWILPVQREVLLVPMPTTRYADTSARVLHCDTGRAAIEWSGRLRTVLSARHRVRRRPVPKRCSAAICPSACHVRHPQRRSALNRHALLDIRRGGGCRRPRARQ